MQDGPQGEKETLAESAAEKLRWQISMENNVSYANKVLLCIDEIPSQETVCPLASDQSDSSRLSLVSGLSITDS